MLSRKFDPNLRHRVAIYRRMSGDQQNPRSPEQQSKEIQKRLKALGYRWVIVKVFTDAAKTGRLLRHRPEYQQMMREIKSGALAVDLILVDTLERFGRVEELTTIRKELYERHGVLVLTADTNFADPTTPQGKALGMFEAMRATEDGRIKAHNVLRGKRDAASQGHWPGGPPPFGFMLKSIMKTLNGREEVDHCILVPNPKTTWIIVTLFNKAAETSWGTTRLARFLKEHPDIPDEFKPFQPETIGYWLDNPIYYGELLWEKHSTGIVDDMRVVERNADEDMLRVADFCEPLVSRELWEQVQAVRQVRRDRLADARRSKAEANGKQITPPAPGMTLNYLLSGLVYCAECGQRMTVSSSPEYITKSREAKRYTSYACPGYGSRQCTNGKRVPEEWLREVVVAKVRQRLFPWTESSPSSSPSSDAHVGVTTTSDPAPVMVDERLEMLPWLPELMGLVASELERFGEGRNDQRPALEKEIEEIDGKIKGWSESLAKPDLSRRIRDAIEREWETALDRKQEIENLLLELESQQKQAEQLLSPTMVAERLERLADVLATNNPTMGNLELSLHIDRIDCSPDGKVVMRSCKLGSLTGAADLVSDADEPCQEDTGTERGKEKKRTRPRRRGRLRVYDSDDNSIDLRALGEFAADPNRFAGLSEEWFWTDEFHVPGRPLSWAAANADAVFRRRQEAKLSFNKLAVEFGVTAPTVRAAIKHYLAEHPDARDEVDLPRGGPRRPRIDVTQFADEASRLWEAGWSKLKLAEKFGCSSPTIDKALAHAYERDGLPMSAWKGRRDTARAKARQMLAEGRSLDDIAKTLKVSDATARRYLKESYEAEGKPMPDLRTGRRKPRS